MRKIVTLATAIVLMSAIPAIGTSTVSAQEIPDKYKSLYQALDKKLAENEKLIRKSDVVWGGIGVELTSANANRGTDLLKPETFIFIRKNLDALARMGAKGITVNVAFPMLNPSTPRQKEYLSFYKKLTAEVRSRKLTFTVKVHNVFPDAVYGNPAIKLKGMKYEDYLRQKKDQIMLVAKELKPDILTLENEPGTQKFITGFNFTPELWKNTISYFLKDLRHDGIKIGAGAGSWDDIRYFQVLCDLPVDFIDIHVYPIAGDMLAKNIERIVALANSKGKETIIGDAWLYKSETFTWSSFQQNYINAFVSDAYSFWEPLDSRFVKAVCELSRMHRIAYASFFWSTHLFAYIPYDGAYDTTDPKEILKIHNKAVLANMLSNPVKTNKTGQAFQEIQRTQANASVKIITLDGGRVSYSKSAGLIAFDKLGADRYYDVWTMKPDGSEMKCLTDRFPEIPKNNGNPAWHPSGKYIVFQAQDPKLGMKNESAAMPGIGINNNIYIISADGKSLWKMSKVRSGGGSLHPHFSPDGKKLVWSNAIPSDNPIGSWEIMEFDISFNGVPKLLTMDTLFPDKMQLYETHGYSPDGKSLIFSGVPKGKGYFDMEIFTCGTDGRNLKKLTSNSDWDEHAHFSPDGKKIVYASSSNTNCPKEAAKLQLDFWVMNADGSGKKRITFFNDPKHQQYLGKVVAADFDWIDSKTIVAKLGMVENAIKRELVMIVRITI